ncbi:DAAM2 [Symbiodinium necroappetens]|uniref:DAAM2 protein n=1 Tax=Symbiodinium necroappetens TaxID=1628268 RepID=A0A812U0D5_9DINO|nr:DAAM2 [Symbiodinium necroappetens]
MVGVTTARLECMAFVQKFPEELETCKENLESLRRALVCTCNRLPALRRFWATVLQAGNALNSGSMANTTERGFRLASISKLLDLRSPLRRDVSLFHFVLLQLQASDVQDLCSPDFVEALQSAYLRRAFTVHHDTISHLEGFRHIESLVDTGTFKGEKIGIMPAQSKAGAEAPEGHGDPFFSCMRDFATTSREACAEIWSLNAEIQRAYKELSLYFDDPAYVYPPPKDDQDGKRDLLGLLHSFVSDCVRVRQEIDVSDFPAEVRLQCRFSPPYLDSDSSDSSSEVSPTLLTSPDKKGPLLSGPKMEMPGMPSVPPPDRAPKRSQGRSLVLGAPPLSPGTGHPGHQAQALSPVLPTTPGSTGSRQCRTPEPAYDRLARKSLTRQVDRDCAECLGASAARIRGDSGSSLNYTSSSQTSCLSPVSSGSGESARSSICPSDLKTQLRDVWKRRTHTGGREAEPPRALRSPSPAEAAWLSMEFSATTPRRSRTTSLSPVKEQGETPHRPVICQ